MIALQISDVKGFMNKLLRQSVFDQFLLSEAVISTYNTFHIDGKLNKAFYTSEELEDSSLSSRSLSWWHEVKPLCFELIKGKKTPLGFKIVFQFSYDGVLKLLAQSELPFSPGDINGCFLNIRYDGSALSCITGTSLAMFTLDKSLDQAWDHMIKKFLLHSEISFDEK